MLGLYADEQVCISVAFFSLCLAPITSSFRKHSPTHKHALCLRKRKQELNQCQFPPCEFTLIQFLFSLFSHSVKKVEDLFFKRDAKKQGKTFSHTRYTYLYIKPIHIHHTNLSCLNDQSGGEKRPFITTLRTSRFFLLSTLVFFILCVCVCVH